MKDTVYRRQRGREVRKARLVVTYGCAKTKSSISSEWPNPSKEWWNRPTSLRYLVRNLRDLQEALKNGQQGR